MTYDPAPAPGDVDAFAERIFGAGLGAQHRQLEGYAQMLGLHIDRAFVERGVSGSRPLADRPAHRLRISPAFVTDRDAERQTPGSEHATS